MFFAPSQLATYVELEPMIIHSLTPLFLQIERQIHLHETLVVILEQNAKKLKLTKSGNHVLNRLEELREVKFNP